MLATTIAFQGPLNETIFEVANLKKNSETHYQLFPSKTEKAIADFFVSEGKITVNYSSELALADYHMIHDIIEQLRNALNGEVDDSESFLGYLPDGESVYIWRNWDKWVSFIYDTMTNCKNNTSM